jgi:hypothetical protein
MIYTTMATQLVAQAFPAQNTIEFNPARAGTNGTLIAVILDESGSMQSCWDATITGYNEFVAGQASTQGAGEAYLTLVKFDSPRVSTVYENVHVREVAPLTRATYTPNGGTNLMDAVGYTLNRINTFLNSLAAQERPGVLIQIITDGEENASRNYHGETIRAMVRRAETEGDWTFQFLGANVDAFAMGASLGMNAANSAAYNTASMAATMDVIMENTRAVRSAKVKGVSTADLYASGVFYSDVDRARMKGE